MCAWFCGIAKGVVHISKASYYMFQAERLFIEVLLLWMLQVYMYPCVCTCMHVQCICMYKYMYIWMGTAVVFLMVREEMMCPSSPGPQHSSDTGPECVYGALTPPTSCQPGSKHH